MAFGNLQAAVIVALVVLVSLTIAKGPAIEAAENLANTFGLDLGKPRVSSFSATPSPSLADGETNMKFEASLGGSKQGVTFEVYRTFSDTPDSAPKPEEINKKVFSLKTPRLQEVLKEKGILSVHCPKESDDNGCVEDPAPVSYDKPGWHVFTAQVIKKKVLDEKSQSVGMFNEEYVELLDRPIKGCDAISFSNCNVFECKKARINDKLYVIQFSVSAAVDKIVNELISSTCVKRNTNPKVVDALDFSGCTDKKDVDSFNTKFARVRMLILVNSISGATSENDYAKFADGIEDYKKLATSDSLFCTQGPGGAYSHLKSLGWVPLPSETSFDKWQNKIGSELDNVLSKLRPAIASIVAAANIGGDGKVTLKWTLPIGKGTITKYELKLFQSPSAPKENKVSAVKKLPIGEFVVKQPGITDLEVKYPETGILPSDKMGTYWFTITAFDKDGASDTKDGTTGIYDSSYIEQYRDLKGVDDACGGDCDVAGKKENGLGNDKLGWSTAPSGKKYTEEAFEKNKGKFQPSCHLEPKKKGEERISGCLGSEVSIMYEDVLREYAKTLPAGAFRLGKNVDDLLKLDCWTETWMKSNKRWRDDTGVWGVCEAKEDLYKRLVKLGWAYVAK